MKNVCIIGLGYVGFPLAQLCAKKGYTVTGIDFDEKKINLVNAGTDPVEGGSFTETITASTNDTSMITKADVIIICVPTPVDKMKMPDLSPVKSATSNVITHLDKTKKPLIIVESTINPGVMEDVVKPLFDKENLTVGKDYYLAHCPERVNPGDPKWNVENIPRVLGAFTTEGLDVAHTFYEDILEAPVKKMSKIRTAEACKVVENAFRDINIAFVNELAKSFDKMGIDVVEVISGASTKPFAFMPHKPSCGVGGHCIPVDPYYLIEKAKSYGFDHRFLRLAREINNSMPEYTIDLLQDALNENKRCLNGTTIGILGLSYKAGVGDMRESPSLIIIESLKKKGAKILTFDPYVKGDTTSLEEIQTKTDVLLLCTGHKEFSKINFAKVAILIDGQNFFAGKEPTCTYRGIGRDKQQNI